MMSDIEKSVLIEALLFVGLLWLVVTLFGL